MKISTIILGIIFSSLLSLSYADSFEQHATSIYKGRIAKPNFKSMSGSIEYKTRIREGIKEGVSFAGHYTIIQIGCGTGCSFAFLIDIKTGKIFDFPLGGEDNLYLSLKYYPNSTLMKASWSSYKDYGSYSEENEICVNQEYLLIKNKFKLLSEKKTSGSCPYEF